MNPGRFFMPGMGMGPMMRSGSMFPRNVGFFSRIGSGFRSFNWRGLLSGANKTLNVVNQTIPLIRQARPMVNNVRSMLQLAKAFGSETVSTRKNNRNLRNINTVGNRNSTNDRNNENNFQNNTFSQDNNDSSSIRNNPNAPVFFV